MFRDAFRQGIYERRNGTFTRNPRDQSTSDSSMPSLHESRSPSPRGRTNDAEPELYTGDESSCAMCQQDFLAGEAVCRLRCRHMFHTYCWNYYRDANFRHPCPICRGRGERVAAWRFIEPTVPTQVGANGTEVTNDLPTGADTPEPTPAASAAASASAEAPSDWAQ